MIFVIGTGMDGDRTLTMQAREAIEKADLLIGAERMLAPFAASGKELFCTYKTEEILQKLRTSDARNAAVLMSGDCGFYSGAKALTAALGADAEILSGIASPVYFCGKIGKNWENMHFVSLHGTAENAAVHVRLHESCFFLLGGRMTASGLCRKLCAYGLSDVRIWIGERLGYPEERIHAGKAADFCEAETDHLAVAVTENPAYFRSMPMGIPDDAFLRTRIPMTKSEIRLLTLAKLAPEPDSICYDIGCGTGSVSVEMALHCPSGKVYAFDRSPDAAALTMQNAERFSCDNITAFSGEYPDIPELSGLPAPDRVFVGGSGGRLSEIIRQVLARNPAAVVVLNAVTLETLFHASETFAEHGITPEITQISVTRTRKVGSSTMLDAQNPVFILKGVRL